MKAARHETAPAPVTVIKPFAGWVALRLDALWAYRELLFFLCWRDLKVRYKQTALGAAWAVIQPLFTMTVFSVFFGRLAQIPSDGISYPIFAYAALVPWGFFANSLNNSSNSLVDSANLLRKVYFPRLAIPLATVLSGVVDCAIAFAVLLGMMLYYHITPTANIMWLPLLLLLALVTALGVGLWLSALNVRYHDVRYTVPFMVQTLVVCHPRRLPQQPAGRALAHALRHQPDGRGGRGLPLGLAGDGDRAGADDSRVGLGGAGAFSRRSVLFPVDEEGFC